MFIHDKRILPVRRLVMGSDRRLCGVRYTPHFVPTGLVCFVFFCHVTKTFLDAPLG